DAITVFLRVGPLSGNFRWRHLPARANGQAAVGCYTWHPEEESFLPFALDVLTLDGERIKEVTAFITRSAEVPDPRVFARWPDEPADAAKVVDIFERFGLPSRLD
ncbi:MAG TPA: RNA polymerase subunit sigma-70, partial [Gemmatimonadota bacterium]|nr:RNA polymerase subunit sigma-70 [Gemmatimonadota bacterium]